MIKNSVNAKTNSQHMAYYNGSRHAYWVGSSISTLQCEYNCIEEIIDAFALNRFRRIEFVR